MRISPPSTASSSPPTGDLTAIDRYATDSRINIWSRLERGARLN